MANFKLPIAQQPAHKMPKYLMLLLYSNPVTERMMILEEKKEPFKVTAQKQQCLLYKPD